MNFDLSGKATYQDLRQLADRIRFRFARYPEAIVIGQLVNADRPTPRSLPDLHEQPDFGQCAASVQVGLFLGCVSCHSSAEAFFLLNFLIVEGSCEVFGLEDLADLYVGVAYVENGTALDPLDGLFERLDLPEPEAGDEFLAFREGAVGDGAVLTGEVDAGTFGGGVKAVVA